MRSTAMTVDEATSVLAQLPQSDAFQCFYDTDTLYYPDALESAVTAAYGDLSPGLKAQLKAYAATKRWSIETGGCNVAGMLIDTSRDSQAQIMTAWRDLQENPGKILQWKQSNGVFIAVDQAKMDQIRQGVAMMISEVFDDEKQASDMIEAGTITTTAEVDAVFNA